MNNRSMILTAGSLILACHAALATTLLVATNGTDTNPGTEEKPFATLERAREEIRKIRDSGRLPVGGITVEVRGGVYELARPVEWTDKGHRTRSTVGLMLRSVLKLSRPSHVAVSTRRATHEQAISSSSPFSDAILSTQALNSDVPPPPLPTNNAQLALNLPRRQATLSPQTKRLPPIDPLHSRHARLGIELHGHPQLQRLVNGHTLALRPAEPLVAHRE